ncbi:MAG: tetratricopeptide repeat protein [bacterium]|nr:tetratricopeptide repeat protein [bacterium]
MRSKVLIFILVVFVLSLFSLPAIAQDDQLWWCREIKVKPGKAAQWRELFTQYIELCEKHNFPFTWHTHHDGDFNYFLFMAVDDHQQINEIMSALADVGAEFGAERNAEWATTYDYGKDYYLKALGDLTYNPEKPRLNSDENNYHIWDILYIKPDMMEKAMELNKEWLDMLKSKNYGDNITVCSGDVGWETPVLIGVLPGKNKADYLEQNRKMWDLLGDEGTRIFNEYLPCIRKRESEEFFYVKSLSYTPITEREEKRYDWEELSDNPAAVKYLHDGWRQLDSGLSVTSQRKAIDMFQRAVNIDPDYKDAILQLSYRYLWLYWNNGQGRPALEKSREILGQLKDLASSDWRTTWLEGYMYYYGSRDYDNALKKFHKIEDTAPFNMNGPIGFVYRRNGQWDEAVKYLKKYVENNPDGYNTNLNMGQTFLRMRRYDEAAEHFERAKKANPKNLAPYTQGVNICLAKNDMEGAYNMLDDAKKQNIDPKSFNNTSYYLDAIQGKYLDAMKHVEHRKGTYMHHLYKGWTYTFTGKDEQAKSEYDEARKILESRVENYPNSAAYHRWLAYAYAGLGRNKEAIRAGEKSVDLFPMKRDAFAAPAYALSLAQIYTITGKHDKAIKELKKLLSVPALTSLNQISMDPWLAPLRTHKKFKDLAKSEKIW